MDLIMSAPSIILRTTTTVLTVGRAVARWIETYSIVIWLAEVHCQNWKARVGSLTNVLSIFEASLLLCQVVRWREGFFSTCIWTVASRKQLLKVRHSRSRTQIMYALWDEIPGVRKALMSCGT